MSFEARPELEWEMTLALRLRRTVQELRLSMSNAEWRAWSVYDQRRRQERELAEKMAQS